MKKVSNPFRKLGIVLLLIGILDITLLIYCIANKINYSSGINIFAMTAGILLIRGSVKSARVIRWFSLFFIVTFTLILSVFPLTMPFELLIIEIKLKPYDLLAYYAYTTLLIGILIYVYYQLSSPASLAILEDYNFQTSSPPSAIYVALGLIVVGGLIFGLLLNSESAVKAKTLAKEQLGDRYKYHVGSLSISGDKGSARVTAYNPNEIKDIQVKW